MKTFPIIGEAFSWQVIDGSKPLVIPWWLAEIAYSVYVKHYGNDSSLERLAERGGFGIVELLSYLEEVDPARGSIPVPSSRPAEGE